MYCWQLGMLDLPFKDFPEGEGDVVVGAGGGVVREIAAATVAPPACLACIAWIRRFVFPQAVTMRA